MTAKTFLTILIVAVVIILWLIAKIADNYVGIAYIDRGVAVRRNKHRIDQPRLTREQKKSKRYHYERRVY